MRGGDVVRLKRSPADHKYQWNPELIEQYGYGPFLYWKKASRGSCYLKTMDGETIKDVSTTKTSSFEFCDMEPDPFLTAVRKRHAETR